VAISYSLAGEGFGALALYRSKRLCSCLATLLAFLLVADAELLAFGAGWEPSVTIGLLSWARCLCRFLRSKSFEPLCRFSHRKSRRDIGELYHRLGGNLDNNIPAPALSNLKPSGMEKLLYS
jgi:hypothetical protein